MQFLLGERLIPPQKVSFLIFSKNVWPQDRFSGQNGRYLLCSGVRQYDIDTGEKSGTHGKVRILAATLLAVLVMFPPLRIPF